MSQLAHAKILLALTSSLLVTTFFAASSAPIRGSVNAPRTYKGIPWKVFQQEAAEQIAQMYVVHDGKWIQIRKWPEPVVGNFSEKKSLLLTPEAKQVPFAYACVIDKIKDGELVQAHITPKGGGVQSTAMLVLPSGLEPPSVGETLQFWLAEDVPAETRTKAFPFKALRVLTDEEAATYHSPSAKEAAQALKAGQTFVVNLKTYSCPCPSCNGSGIDAGKIEQIKADSERAGGFVRTPTKGKYHPTGSLPLSRNKNALTTDSALFAKTKTDRNKPKCPACEGKGKIFQEEYRQLVY